MKLNTPTINKTSLDVMDVGSLESEARLEQVLLTGEGVGLRAPNANVEESALERALLIEAKLEKLGLKDVVLKACDFSAARCSESSFLRAYFKGGRMAGVDFSRSTLHDVVFEDCKLDMANFRFTKLKRVRFVNCIMNETEFQVAELSEVDFESCHLEKVEFAQCKIKQVDVRTSQLYDIRSWQSLKGLIIDPTQLVMIAPELANELGIVVKAE